MPKAAFDDLQRFYALLDGLATKVGGTHQLAVLPKAKSSPARGVYFFFEPGEVRSDTGFGQRVVRVGTHGLKAGSSSTLRGRLAQHRGQVGNGGGNHRGSIFRLLVGASLMRLERDRTMPSESWGKGSNAPALVRAEEQGIERDVSRIIGAMPFLWLAVDDDPGPESLRGVIERNAIALLSNRGRAPIDPPSVAWLGHECNRERVRSSGLWNSNHVDDDYDPAFLDTLQTCIDRMEAVG